MIMVESRFRVANGLEEAVRQAFIDRPGLVDDVAGFLGMDVYTESRDGCVFHLVTRWTDHAAYDTWHRGEAHRDSHAFIPRGLKLDAAFTRLTILERIESPNGPRLSSTLADSGPALARWLVDAVRTYGMLVDLSGDTCLVNGALADRLSVPDDGGPVSFAGLLSNDEGADLIRRIDALRMAGSRGTADDFCLNLVNASTHSPFTLRCRMDVQPGYALILAEDADAPEDHLRDELLQTNNQLAVLARESEMQRQTLASSYWHIQRIHEMLPLCLDCGDVKSADGSWQPLRAFLMAYAKNPFLTHGYCPPCAARAIEKFEREGLAP